METYFNLNIHRYQIDVKKQNSKNNFVNNYYYKKLRLNNN